MMYIFLPEYDGPTTVLFTYKQSLSEKVGIGITIGTLFAIHFFVVLKRYGVYRSLKSKLKSEKSKIQVKSKKILKLLLNFEL